MAAATNENGPSGRGPDEPRGGSHTTERQADHTASAGAVHPSSARPAVHMALYDVPDGPARAWLAVHRDADAQQYWLTAADGDLIRVTADAADNWISAHGEVRVYCRDGSVHRPTDDPIDLPDIDHETLILDLAARRLRAGRPLDLGDEARVDLARRRLALWRQMEGTL